MAQTTTKKSSEQIRAEFPVLTRLVRDKKLVYLDNAATTLKPNAVIDQVIKYYREGTANIHRGVHLLSEEATTAYEQTRVKVQKLLNATSESEVVLTSGTTHAINLVAHSFVQRLLKKDDEILISALEHHANIVPWQMLCSKTGARLVVGNVNNVGELDFDDFSRKVSERTKFISVSYASNAIGSMLPILKIITLAKKNSIPLMIDAAQVVAHQAIDVQALDVDFLVFSGHKLFGPTGVGVLFGKAKHLDIMPPMFGGGDMIKSVSFSNSVFADPPARFEAGTPDIAAVIGLGAAIDFVTQFVGFEWIQNHEALLCKHAKSVLRDIPGLNIIGQAHERVPVFSFVLDAIHPHDLGTILDQHGIAVRTGHHCAQPLLEAMGAPSTARMSLSIYNTVEDIDSLVKGLWRAKELFA